jgi:hypothetical protein
MKDKKKRKQLRKAIRPHYLRDACKIPEKTLFQNACEQLQQYLDNYANTDEDYQEIEKYVIYRVKTYFMSLLWFGASPTGMMMPGANHNVGAYTIIDEIIASMYTNFYMQNINTIGYVCRGTYSLDKELKRISAQFEVDESDGYPKECTFRKLALQYHEMIRSVCIYPIPQSNSLKDCILSQEQINFISKQMEQCCVELYAIFCGKPHDWMNEAYFRTLWKRYNEVLITYDGSLDLASTTEEAVKLCSALLLCRVLVEVQQVKETALGAYTELKKYLAERDGS